MAEPCSSWRQAMRRRDFITGIAGLGVAGPLAAQAQQDGRLRQIGVLTVYEEEDDPRLLLKLFRQELQKLGWTEGSNIRFDFRSHRGDVNRAGNSAAELV